MASVLLRACFLVQRNRCSQEFVSVGRSVTYFARNSTNIKKFAPTLQAKHFCSKEDNESERTLIYKGILGNQLRNLKAFSFLTSTFAFVCQPYIYLQASENDNIIPMLIGFTTVSIFAVCTPVLLHLIAKKYVTDLYYCPKEEKYTAEVYTFFLRKKQIEFKVDDVYVPDITGMFTSCIIKGTPVFLDERNFSDVTHYFNIMGYNKPIDFKLGNVEHIKLTKENSEQPQTENK